MKKAILTIALMLITISMFGQNGYWIFNTTKGDELLNTSDSYYAQYIEGGNRVVFMDGYVFVYSADGIFDVEYNSILGECIHNCKIGLYNENKELVYRIDRCLFTPPHNDYDVAYFYNANKNTCQKVVDYLINYTNTYVRIVIPKHFGGNLDIMCPSYSKWCKDNNITNEIAIICPKSENKKSEEVVEEEDYNMYNGG